MILSVSRDSFMEDILAGIKVTTFRLDPKNRWHNGRVIQFWRGNPRNVKNNPFEFATGICTGVEQAYIDPIHNIIFLDRVPFSSRIMLDGIARKDGFKDWEDMKTFFPKLWSGKRIHFKIT
jgi:hypothetical protein